MSDMAYLASCVLFSCILIFADADGSFNDNRERPQVSLTGNESRNKKARDVISSFLNAWKSSKILPEYRTSKDRTARSQTKLPHGFSLEKLDFLSQGKNKLDGPSLFALQSSLNPKPVAKHKTQPVNNQARTYFGDSNDDDEISPEMKLASLISKPIYHDVHGDTHRVSDDEYKQYMFPNSDGMDANHFGLPNDDWQTKRSSIEIPNRTVRLLAMDDDDDDDDGRQDYYPAKRDEIMRARDLEKSIRKQRDGIPFVKNLIDEDQLKRILEESGEKKELITDPHNFLSLPVSDTINNQQSDRKFYKTIPSDFIDMYGRDEQGPAEFKLQKKHLWGNIQKRWRRSKIRSPMAFELQQNEKRSNENLGENGRSFDAYGSIGQDMSQSLMKLNTDKDDTPCKEASQQNGSPIGMLVADKSPMMLLRGSDLQQDKSRPNDNGIIQVSQDGLRRRSGIEYEPEGKGFFRGKRAALLLKKKILHDTASKKGTKSSKAADTGTSKDGAATRTLRMHYHASDSDDGIPEDNVQESLDDRLAHDSTPLLMKIAQHDDDDDVRKFWNNKNSPGNGYYTGHGEGPNHPYLGDYFGHGPEEMEHDDGVKSLEDSPSLEDHHTANIIDSIWEHDLGDDHLGEHQLERHHPGLKIKNYFGNHHSPGIMLPAETLDGIDTHWNGHLSHGHPNDYEHGEGRPVEFAPSRIKAIQAIQDDPSIDAELNPHEGIGTPIGGHGHHAIHSFHNEGHAFGGMSLGPVVNDPVQGDDNHEEEYKQQNDNLLSQYHGLEEHLRGTSGTLAGHLAAATAFGHHGHHHLHTGYDMYAYKNPWDNMRIPYHVPVVNHPSGAEESPPPPLTFGGKTDEKGAPMIEGGKEEGGKGGPLVEGGKEEGGKGGPLVEGGKGGPMVEGSKVSAAKEEKDQEAESQKGAKQSGGKTPLPVIPKQRGGPELSTGGNNTVENETASIEEGEKKEPDSKDPDQNDENSQETFNDVVAKLINSSGKQSEMLNKLNNFLNDKAANPNIAVGLKLAKLKQLEMMQKLLLSSLAKQEAKQEAEKPQEPEKETTSSELTNMKQLLELQSLQQLGAGLSAGSLINTLKQNALLHSIKAAENFLKSEKMHSALKEASSKDNKQHESSAFTGNDIQSFFSKVPSKSFSSDLGDVGSEESLNKVHTAEQANLQNLKNMNVNELIKNLEAAHSKKHVAATNQEQKKPVLSNLLSDNLLSNKIKQIRATKSHFSNKNNLASEKIYSTIGNEGPTASGSDENGHKRSTHPREKKRSKSQTKHKKLDLEGGQAENGVAKAAILSYDNSNIDEDDVSKKTEVIKNRFQRE